MNISDANVHDSLRFHSSSSMKNTGKVREPDGHGTFNLDPSCNVTLFTVNNVLNLAQHLQNEAC